jgi:hypothetical protein
MPVSLLAETRNRLPSEPKRSGSAMEGDGAYNKHAKLPLNGANLAIPFLEKAVNHVAVDASERPIVIADYGSSQGKNSLLPIRVAVRGLRKRVGSSRPISVFHIDQPCNDFNSLFEVLDTDPDRYTADDREVYPAAIGQSFYQPVLPPGSVHLGWSSYAAIWLSKLPAYIPGHFIAVRSNGAVRTAFEQQAAADWKTFLALRARELRPGGRLIVVLPGLSDSGTTGLEPLFDEANMVLGEMVTEGTITSDERSRMALMNHPRRKCDLLAPFGDGDFERLTVEDFAVSDLIDSDWERYQRDRDNETLAGKRARFLRSVFAPSLASALIRAANSQVCRDFADRLEQGLKRRLASQPVPMHTCVQSLVLATTLDGRKE